MVKRNIAHRDLSPDELEHPEQTRELQAHFAISPADQRSLERIETRLLARNQQSSSQIAPQHLLVDTTGHFSQPQPPRKKAPQVWRILALVAILLLAVVTGSLLLFPPGTKPALRPPTPIKTPTAPHAKAPIVFQFEMISATVGWGTGWSTRAGAPVRIEGREGPSFRYAIPAIVRTGDGGQTWQSLDTTEQPTDGGFFKTFFLNDTTAWFIPGTIFDPKTPLKLLRTTDSGQHWQTFQLPLRVQEITFIDQQHGWGWSNSLPSEGDEVNALFQTSDGGQTWQQIATTDAGLLPHHISSFAFTTPQKGWLTTFLLRDERVIQLYQTADGGRTWRQQELPLPTEGAIPGIHTSISESQNSSSTLVTMPLPTFVSPQHGFIGIYSRIGATAPGKMYVYETQDGGSTWSVRGNVLQEDANQRLAIPVVTIFDATHILLHGKDAPYIYEYQAGSWQEQPGTIPGQKQRETAPFNSSVDIHFIDAQIGWVSFNTGSKEKNTRIVYRTTNGGRSWTEIWRQDNP